MGSFYFKFIVMLHITGKEYNKMSKINKLRLDKKILEEITKCIQSPYYFATTYLTITNGKGEIVKYSTYLSEKEYNTYFNKLTMDKILKINSYEEKDGPGEIGWNGGEFYKD